MAETTTIRLPPKLRARIHALAKQSGRSAHSFILEAVERHADYEEQMRSLVKEALAADEEIERTGDSGRCGRLRGCAACGFRIARLRGYIPDSESADTLSARR
jgi:predicted DNA-binding protein